MISPFLHMFKNRADSGTAVCLWILWNFYKYFFTEHLQETASMYNTSIIVYCIYKFHINFYLIVLTLYPCWRQNKYDQTYLQIISSCPPPPQLAHDVVTIVFWSRRQITLSQRCHNVVFPTSLLRPKTNVVTALCFRRRFSNLVLTLQQHRDSDVVFLTKI